MCSNTHAASMLNTYQFTPTLIIHEYLRFMKQTIDIHCDWFYESLTHFLRVSLLLCHEIFTRSLKIFLTTAKYFKLFVSSLKMFMAPVSFDSFTAIFIYFLTFCRCALNRKMMYASKHSNLDLKECLADLRKLFIDVWFIVLISRPLWRNWESVRRTRLVEM